MGDPSILPLDGTSFKLNFKWPGGGGFTCHQDYPAYDLLGPRLHITAMVVIDEANEENGCLQVASNWREVASTLSNFTEEEKQTGHLTLPFVQGGPKHGTVKQEYIYGY